MSRIGKKPVEIPSGVTVAVADRVINVEGPKGKLTFTHRPEVNVAVEDNVVSVSRDSDDRTARELHGLTRALVNNMVEGVTQGYEKKLEIVGVGYLANIAGDTLQLRVGFANELSRKIPSDLNVNCPDQTHIVIQGCDKQKVTQFAAEIRALRKPEPYKGKGIRYQGEHVKIKPGKAATK
ncbi:50S ribosomal protein L6 [Roseiconus lacunae]|uniref:Large ribosomal subunit protein uL6 n=1 Tax=Roseiconus lacunae TaxID=2605694 RepID=A0ABT7PSM2_9BACT|nr:50S ribosomal protein L6 [Roseiconus lacunae]MCD0460266.1 50S ribosomal protein L6 [Roseiconus lacunae]MDM4019279.1 50S ribosomal protein L6 [Roseiconus lacunae]WRQ51908.1 50S ribosomal protein L6 [Stieleria sp. HD01]